jgi:PKD repeat protein
MRKNIVQIVMLLAALGCMAGTAGASSIYFDPAGITIQQGSTGQAKIYLSDTTAGLGGYEMIVKYPPTNVKVSDASFPSWAGLNNKYSVANGYLISGIDLNRQVQGETSTVELGTVTFSGIAPGSSTVLLTGFRMSDDNGNNMTPSLGTLLITVEESATTVTTTTAMPTPTVTPVTTTTTKPATTTAVTGTSTTVPVTTGTTASATTAAVTSTTVVPAATVTVPPVVMVTPEIGGYPTCGFTVNKAVGYAPLKVQFRDLSTGVSLSGWEWSFGDGSSTMTQNPGYTYSTPGTYTVTLTVTNDLGSTTSTRTGLIRVLGPGEAMPTVIQTAPLLTTSTTQPEHTLPVWTSPQKTAAPTKKAASGIMGVIATLGLALAGYAVMRK